MSFHFKLALAIEVSLFLNRVVSHSQTYLQPESQIYMWVYKCVIDTKTLINEGYKKQKDALKKKKKSNHNLMQGKNMCVENLAVGSNISPVQLESI